jgi:hypothetical protein
MKKDNEPYYPYGSANTLNNKEYQIYKDKIINDVLEKRNNKKMEDISSNNSTDSVLLSSSSSIHNIYPFNQLQNPHLTSGTDIASDSKIQKSLVTKKKIQIGKNISKFSDTSEIQKTKTETCHYNYSADFNNNSTEVKNTEKMTYEKSKTDTYRPTLSIIPSNNEKEYINRCKTVSLIRNKWDYIINELDNATSTTSSSNIKSKKKNKLKEINKTYSATKDQSHIENSLIKGKSLSQSIINLPIASYNTHLDNHRVMKRSQSAHLEFNNRVITGEKSSKPYFQNTLILTPVKLNSHDQLNNYMNSRIESIKYSNHISKKNRSSSYTNIGLSSSNTDNKTKKR